MDYEEILRQTIDLHVHVGPEKIPRKFAVPEVVDYERGKLKGLGVKSHFFPTITMAGQSIRDGAPFVVYSVVLNHYVGGFNPDIIRASAELSGKLLGRPIIVWFPTIHSENFLRKHKFETPQEWFDPKERGNVSLRLTEDIKPLSVFDENKRIRKEVEDVMHAIKESDAILATGHLSWQESRELVRLAVKKVGIKRIIVTHPIYQDIDMPIDVQKEIAGLGAMIEHCYSMYSIDKIPMDKIAQQIKAVGADRCILSSDVGQTFSRNPSESLKDFISLLEQQGATEDEIRTMLIRNPTQLVG